MNNPQRIHDFLRTHAHHWFLAVLSVIASVAMATAQAIPASEAARHIGQHATVCGNITGEHPSDSRGRTPTFIYIDRPYPNQVFMLLVWGSDRELVGPLPTAGRICGIGVITEYRGSPEIALRDSKSWYVPK
jgi:hypothetical protein